MAYTYDQVEYDLGSVTATSTGDKVGWSPGYVPHYIRAIAFQVSTSEATNPASIIFTTQAEGFVAGATPGDIGTLNITTKDAKGQVIYLDGINEKIISPGNRLVVTVLVAGGQLVGNAKIFAEPSFETPANNATGYMRATT